MKRKIIIVFVLILVLSMTFCMSGVAFADSTQSVNGYVYEYANKFVNNIEGGVIKDTIPIYDINDNISSCCFTIYVAEEPYMYIILDNYYREGISPIIEFGFGECNFNKDEKIVNLNYIDYGVKKNNVVKFNNQEVDTKAYKIKYPASIQNKLSNPIDGGYFDDLYDLDDELKKAALVEGFNRFEPFIQDDLASPSCIGDGICGATTAMNVLKFYYDTKYYFGDDMYYHYDAYSKLRSYQSSDNPYNIENQSKRKTALTKYVQNNSSLKITANKYIINSWTYIYNDINNGKLVDYRYDGTEGGHCVLVVGAAKFKSNGNFIYVADTWNKNLRWLNFGYHDNIKCMSIKIYE